MIPQTLQQPVKKSVRPLARAGLVAKGFVYSLLGLMAFMAAFELGQGSDQTDKEGVMKWVLDLPGGRVLLAITAAGLACYALWRMIQAVKGKRNQKGWKEWGLRLRYAFSALVYGSLAAYALRMLLHRQQEGGGSNKTMAAWLLDHPFGQLLLWLVALGIAGAGIYQWWYGFSGKYRKHVDELDLHTGASSLLLWSGKVGYFARGFVWLLIAFMLVRAALYANAAEAGDTADAFRFLEAGTMGSLLLGALGLGLICYGLFNFIRARYDSFKE